MRGLDVADEVKLVQALPVVSWKEGNTLSMEKRLVLIREHLGKDDSAVVD